MESVTERSLGEHVIWNLKMTCLQSIDIYDQAKIMYSSLQYFCHGHILKF